MTITKENTRNKQGKLLRDSRDALGLSMADIARILNPHIERISYPETQLISNWERGKQAVSSHKVRAVANAYGITMDELLSAMATDYIERIKGENNA